MNAKEFLQDPETANLVVQRIKTMAPELWEKSYPKPALVAGSAVADILWELWTHEKVANSNDIDVFIHGPTETAGKEIDGSEAAVGSDIPKHYVGNHAYLKAQHQRREGIIDIVHAELVDTETGERSAPAAENLLRYFDLNCCQAGIELTPTGRKLKWDPEFEVFLEKKNIKLNRDYRISTNTFARYAIKSEKYRLPINRLYLARNIATLSDQPDWGTNVREPVATRIPENTSRKITPEVEESLKGLFNIKHTPIGTLLIPPPKEKEITESVWETGVEEGLELFDACWIDTNPKLDPDKLKKSFGRTKITGLGIVTAGLRLKEGIETIGDYKLCEALCKDQEGRPSLIKTAIETHQIDVLREYFQDAEWLIQSLKKPEHLLEAKSHASLLQIEDLLDKDAIETLADAAQNTQDNDRIESAESITIFRQILQKHKEGQTRKFHQKQILAQLSRTTENPKIILDWTQKECPELRRNRTFVEWLTRQGFAHQSEALYGSSENYRLALNALGISLEERLRKAAQAHVPEDAAFGLEANDLLKPNVIEAAAEYSNGLATLTQALHIHKEQDKHPIPGPESWAMLSKIMAGARTDGPDFQKKLLANIAINFFTPDKIEANLGKARELAEWENSLRAAEWLGKIYEHHNITKSRER